MTIGPRKQRAGDYRRAQRRLSPLDSRGVLLARTGESTTWEYTSPRITPPLRLARSQHRRIRVRTNTRTQRLVGRACARVSARKQRVSIHFSPVRDPVSPGITAAFYPCAHHVTEAAITNLEARPSRAKSLGFAARRGRPLSHVICMERGFRYIRYIRARAPLADGRKEARETRDRGPKGVVIHVAKSIARYANIRRATDGGIICTPARAR